MNEPKRCMKNRCISCLQSFIVGCFFGVSNGN